MWSSTFTNGRATAGAGADHASKVRTLERAVLARERATLTVNAAPGTLATSRPHRRNQCSAGSGFCHGTALARRRPSLDIQFRPITRDRLPSPFTVSGIRRVYSTRLSWVRLQQAEPVSRTADDDFTGSGWQRRQGNTERVDERQCHGWHDRAIHAFFVGMACRIRVNVTYGSGHWCSIVSIPVPLLPVSGGAPMGNKLGGWYVPGIRQGMEWQSVLVPLHARSKQSIGAVLGAHQ